MKQKQLVSPPTSQQQLMERCQQLAGKTLASVATQLGLAVPDNLLHHKGWVGHLLEIALGANAGSLAEPDFVELAIELKTLPLNSSGEPKESTYVCTVATQQLAQLTWQQSWLRRKLSHVLWIPVEADNSISLAERYIGQAWLWKPNVAQEAILERDWNELMDRIIAGEHAQLSGKEGQYLQIRPKAANSRTVEHVISEDSAIHYANPKGFYLRPQFTQQLLQESN